MPQISLPDLPNDRFTDELYTFSKEYYKVEKQRLVNLRQFEETRRQRSNQQGFFRRKGWRWNWKYTHQNGKQGRLFRIKNNDEKTLTAQRFLGRTVTYAWEDLVVFE